MWIGAPLALLAALTMAGSGAANQSAPSSATDPDLPDSGSSQLRMGPS